MSWLEILRTNGKQFHQFFQDELKLIIVTMQTRIDSSLCHTLLILPATNRVCNRVASPPYGRRENSYRYLHVYGRCCFAFHQFFQDELKFIIVTIQTRIDSSLCHTLLIIPATNRVSRVASPPYGRRENSYRYLHVYGRCCFWTGCLTVTPEWHYLLGFFTLLWTDHTMVGGKK